MCWALCGSVLYFGKLNKCVVRSVFVVETKKEKKKKRGVLYC